MNECFDYILSVINGFITRLSMMYIIAGISLLDILAGTAVLFVFIGFMFQRKRS